LVLVRSVRFVEQLRGRNTIPGSDSYEFSWFARIDDSLRRSSLCFPRVRSRAARGISWGGTPCPRKTNNGILFYICMYITQCICNI